MVDRGAHDGQAEGDVHPLVASERLEGDEALVVVEAHPPIMALAGIGGEGAVGREGALGLDAVRAQGVDRGRHQPGLVVAEQPALAGMGIEPEDGQAWARPAQARQRRIERQPHRDDARGGEAGDRLGERHVAGGKHHRDRRVVHEHRLVGGSAARRQPLGVPGEGQAGEVDGLLVDGPGDHAVPASGEAACHRRLDAGGADPSRRRRDPARGRRLGVARLQRRLDDAAGRGEGESEGARAAREHRARADAVDLRRLGDPRVREGLQRDLGADAGGIAHGQGQARAHARMLALRSHGRASRGERARLASGGAPSHG